MPVQEESFASRPLGRRTLIRRGLAFVSAAALTPPAFVRAVFDEASVASAAEQPRRVLVVLQLAGGNDGLNTVIPYTDGAYYDARQRIAANPEAALPLDDRLALHPNLAGLKALYDQGRAAVVLGVGYPNPNRSHFRSMDIWHSASMAEHSETGWIGRLLDATRHEQDSMWRAANVGSSAAPSASPSSPRSTRSPPTCSRPTGAFRSRPTAG
jgi:uncharacterized protein (DUF1501 family)